MDWILIGKSYLIFQTGTVSVYLIKGILRLRRKYGLSFGIEDWVEWKDWFIYYLPYTIEDIRWYFKVWSVGFFGMWIILLFWEKYLG